MSRNVGDRIDDDSFSYVVMGVTPPRVVENYDDAQFLGRVINSDRIFM